MTDDLFEQLRQQEIPAPPENLQIRVHSQVNNWLLFIHLADLATRGMMLAIGQFAQGGLALLGFTLTGKYPDKQKQIVADDSEPKSEEQ